MSADVVEGGVEVVKFPTSAAEGKARGAGVVSGEVGGVEGAKFLMNGVEGKVRGAGAVSGEAGGVEGAGDQKRHLAQGVADAGVEGSGWAGPG